MPDRETYDAVDLFAGPGGWDLAAAERGLHVLGVEWDDAACATRREAGLPTRQGDVAAIDPEDYAGVAGLIASPPCQAFSMAGKGKGRAALPVYARALQRMLDGEQLTDFRDELDEACGDERGHLVLEPLRWVLALRPQWVALEQVKPVLPLWQAMASALRSLGYGADVGVLSAERYGVPQTRQRAIVVARLGDEARLPLPTHQRYVPPPPRPSQSAGLFDAPEPERIVVPEDRHLLPWVSMAEVLGRGMTARPYPTITVGHDRGTHGLIGGEAGREAVRQEALAGRWAYAEELTVRTGSNSMSSSRDAQDMVPYERPLSAPAPTVDTGLGRWRIARPGEHRDAPMRWKTKWRLQTDAQKNAASRSLDEPAPTMKFGHSSSDAGWRDGTETGTAPTLHLAIDEAALLQSFPLGYPWQGSLTKRFEQVGNAVPPLLAWHVLDAVT